MSAKLVIVGLLYFFTAQIDCAFIQKTCSYRREISIVNQKGIKLRSTVCVYVDACLKDSSCALGLQEDVKKSLMTLTLKDEREMYCQSKILERCGLKTPVPVVLDEEMSECVERHDTLCTSVLMIKENRCILQGCSFSPLSGRSFVKPHRGRY